MNKDGYHFKCSKEYLRKIGKIENLVDDSANNEGSQCATRMELAGQIFDEEQEVCNGNLIFKTQGFHTK